MPKWIAYIRAQPSLEILSLAIKAYINDNPKVSKKTVSKDNFFQKFFFDEAFISKLNENGKKIATKVTTNDILDELRPYSQRFNEIKWVYSLISNNMAWCESNLEVLKKQYIQTA